MKFGRDFFKIFNFAIQLIRLFISVFGDDEEVEASVESKQKSQAENEDAC